MSYYELKLVNGNKKERIAQGPTWDAIKEKMEGPGKALKQRLNADASTHVIFVFAMCAWYAAFSLFLHIAPGLH